MKLFPFSLDEVLAACLIMVCLFFWNYDAPRTIATVAGVYLFIDLLFHRFFTLKSRYESKK